MTLVVPNAVGPPRLRAIVRDALMFAGAGLLAPLWLPVRIERWLGKGDGWFAGCSELLSLVPGRPGVMLRRSFYCMTLDSCARDCSVGFGSTFAHSNAKICERVYIGNRCTIGSAVFECDVTIGSNVDILSGRRQHGIERADVPIQAQPGKFEQVRLGRNSWIGNSSVIMADVGAESVVGAGSVVVRAIEAGVVAVGNPATAIKRRAA